MSEAETMSGELRERQQQLVAYLLGQDDSIAQHVADQGGIKTDVRLAIYSNAYGSVANSKKIEFQFSKYPIFIESAKIEIAIKTLFVTEPL